MIVFGGGEWKKGWVYWRLGGVFCGERGGRRGDGAVGNFAALTVNQEVNDLSFCCTISQWVLGSAILTLILLRIMSPLRLAIR